MLTCQIHGIDHRAIASTFSNKGIEGKTTPRLNFRKNDWEAFLCDLTEHLAYFPSFDTVEELDRQTEEIICQVQEATTRYTL